MKYRFNRLRTVEELLEAIGRKDIPSKDVTMRGPAVDEETGEFLSDIEIDFGKHALSSKEEGKLKSVLKEMGYAKFKEKK